MLQPALHGAKGQEQGAAGAAAPSSSSSLRPGDSTLCWHRLGPAASPRAAFGEEQGWDRFPKAAVLGLAEPCVLRWEEDPEGNIAVCLRLGPPPPAEKSGISFLRVVPEGFEPLFLLTPHRARYPFKKRIKKKCKLNI